MSRSLFHIGIYPFAIIVLVVLLSGTVIAQEDTGLYEELTIDALRSREYGSADGLQTSQLWDANAYFTRYLVSYMSDGLRVYGFMNVPVGVGPFPVVVMIHGYVPPATYQTLTYTTRYADALARAGYLVIHPNLRNHIPSDVAVDQPFFEVGYAVDVLNLMADINRDAGRTNTLAVAAPDSIGLWGHSMGGGIALRVMAVSTDVDAAVLYGSMSADDTLNYNRIYSYWTNGAQGFEELSTPPELLTRISPSAYLEQTDAAISIHYGAQDSDVPPEWSVALCGQLESLDKVVECFSYAGQDHILTGESDSLFQQRVVEFFNNTLPQS